MWDIHCYSFTQKNIEYVLSTVLPISYRVVKDMIKSKETNIAKVEQIKKKSNKNELREVMESQIK